MGTSPGRSERGSKVSVRPNRGTSRGESPELDPPREREQDDAPVQLDREAGLAQHAGHELGGPFASHGAGQARFERQLAGKLPRRGSLLSGDEGGQQEEREVHGRPRA